MAGLAGVVVTTRRAVGPVVRVCFFEEAAAGVVAGAAFLATAGVVGAGVAAGDVALASAPGLPVRGLNTWAWALVAARATRPTKNSIRSKRAADIGPIIVPQPRPRSTLLR